MTPPATSYPAGRLLLSKARALEAPQRTLSCTARAALQAAPAQQRCTALVLSAAGQWRRQRHLSSAAQHGSQRQRPVARAAAAAAPDADDDEEDEEEGADVLGACLSI